MMEKMRALFYLPLRRRVGNLETAVLKFGSHIVLQKIIIAYKCIDKLKKYITKLFRPAVQRICNSDKAIKLTDEKDVTGSEAVSFQFQVKVQSIKIFKVTLFGMTVKSATTEELKALMQPLGSPPRNPKFVFHNKIPKAGSTTMKWLLVALARKNGFLLDHARWCLSQGLFMRNLHEVVHVAPLCLFCTAMLILH